VATETPLPAPLPAVPSAPPMPSPEQVEAMAKSMGVDLSAMKGMAAARAMESELRLKKIEAEVFQRGLQLARVERNLKALIEKGGGTYSP
jgi:hypothetical protein